MKKYPKISIITPSFNQGCFIEATIKSVIEQNYPNMEYIVIDGCSTDNSVSIIKQYSNDITYWVSEKDEGQSDAINKGFKIATGKYVTWLNSDDILLENALFKMIDYLERNPEIDVVYGNTIMIDEKGTELQKRYEIDYYNNIMLYAINYIPQPSSLMKKTSLDKIGLLDSNNHYTMDHDLWLRFHYSNSKFAYINEFLSGYRVHNSSKGFSKYDHLIKAERNELKRKYGLKFSNKNIEKLVYLFLFIFFRLKRKLFQIIKHRKTNFLPFKR